jgi:serine protease Do
MNNRRIFFFCALLLTAGHCIFSQTAALRDYVGMISQSFHPDAVSFLEKLKDELDRRGRSAAVRSLDAYIKGNSGTGFVYVASGGTNYILTNYHVISHAQTLSVTFEKQNGEQSRFTGLTIIAADEDMDIALLAFAGGQNPFGEGLRFLNRPVQEGDDVYSAGFPALGPATSTMIWQLGRGMVSNASVRLPMNDDSGKMLGPYIQHTAQVDPGNSGGPLLIQTQGVPTGFAVAGINTLSAIYRQTANYSIPVDRIQSFLNASLNKGPVDQRSLLDARLDSFLEGLKVNRAVYPHIAVYLSNTCTGENAEYAMSEMFAKASRLVQDSIINTFDSSPVEGMREAVAWLIENEMRSTVGSLNIVTESVTANDTGYTVTFKINDKMVASEWVNEYGIWRIYKFGEFASGDKELSEKKAKAKADSERLRADPSFQIGGNFTYILDRGSAFGLDFTLRSNHTGYGFRGCFTSGLLQVEGFYGLYVPIKLNQIALTPFANIGIGARIKDVEEYDSWSRTVTTEKRMDIGGSIQGGLQFTTAAVPGLYLYGGYQFSWYMHFGFDETNDTKNDPHMIFLGVGYAF